MTNHTDRRGVWGAIMTGLQVVQLHALLHFPHLYCLPAALLAHTWKAGARYCLRTASSSDPEREPCVCYVVMK